MVVREATRASRSSVISPGCAFGAAGPGAGCLGGVATNGCGVSTTGLGGATDVCGAGFATGAAGATCGAGVAALREELTLKVYIEYILRMHLVLRLGQELQDPALNLQVH